MNDYDALDAGEVRIEEMLWLPGALVAADTGNDGLDMLLQRLPQRPDAPLFDDLPELRAFIGRTFETDTYISEQAAAALAGRTGFVFAASAATIWYLTPTPSFADWGSHWTAWLYAADERGFVPTALAWAKSCHAADREVGRQRYGWRDD